MDQPTQIVVLLAFGLVTSLISGLLGIGGGIVRIPLFIYLFPALGTPDESMMHMAIGTSVALVIPTAIASSARQYRQGNLDIGFYRWWAVGIFVGVAGGLALVPYVSTEVFQIVFVVFLLAMVAYVGFVKQTTVLSQSPPRGIVKFALAALIGLASALTGTGGGALTTPSLKAFSVPLKKAVATASATGLVVGVIGAIGYVLQGWNTANRPAHSLGYVDSVVFLGMLPTILIGAPLGARLNNHLSETSLKYLYAAFLLIAAGNLIYKLLP